MKRLLVLTGFILLLISSVVSQISHDGAPYSFSQSSRLDIENITMPIVDVETLIAEDEQRPKGRLRFGFEMALNVNMSNSGTWANLDNGGVLWQLKITSANAQSINLTYDNFFIPEGGEFFVYSEDESIVFGAYTHENNNEFRTFATQPIAGDVTILEYYHPNGNDNDVSISIDGVIHGYRSLPGLRPNEDIRTAGACNNNVACPEGDPWANEIRSVSRTLTQGWLCSGALVNNTSEDESQYFLTAYHCIEDLNTAYSIFLWNYQASSCTGTWGPTNQTVQGAVVRATSQNIYSSPDFALLEINTTLPESYNPYFSGWSRSTDYPQAPVGIHHPDGDIKKISFDYEAPFGFNYHKWNLDWDDGVTEPGSSGSPLYDENHYLVGDLSTGSSSCSNQGGDDQYGKFWRSWNYGDSANMRLRDWLDPENLDPEFWEGFDPFAEPEPDPYVLGDVNNDELINVQDIILVVGIILGTVDPDLTMELAADANEDGIINVLDVITVIGIIMDGSLVRGNSISSASLEVYGRSVKIRSNGDVAGIQLTVLGEFSIDEFSLPLGWQIHYNNHTILLFTVDGAIFDDGLLFNYQGSLKIESAIIGDWFARGNSAEILDVTPAGFALHQAYPNPFNPKTNISFELPFASDVTLSVYNIIGEEIANLVKGRINEGIHSVSWNANAFPSGLYFVRLDADNQVLSQKLILLK
jgi:lysyl endopeptidase